MSNKKKGSSLKLPEPEGFDPGFLNKDKRKKDTQKHAEDVKALARGASYVEPSHKPQQSKPDVFAQQDLLVVRDWLGSRPLEPTRPAAALVRYPHMWTTKRGRYCKFKSPGSAVYGLVRARPTF